jgi:poly(A) polymerase
MQTPEVRAVMQVLRDGAATARFVGGCVRDALVGRPIKDIDIATDALPERVIALLRAAGHKVIPTGIEHGTVTVVVGNTSFEVTTLRHDLETDGRHATVAFTDDWVADAARRDLTMNALSLDADGNLHDPFGGYDDLMAGRIRFVGDPAQRITEDYLRLLRYFRFLAHYGRGVSDPDALAACRELAPHLKRLSAERVRAELLKLLEAPDPVPTLELMRDHAVLAHFLPEATEIERLSRLVRIEAGLEAIGSSPMRRLAALLSGDVSTMTELARRLRLSNPERDYLAASRGEPVSPVLEASQVRRRLYRLGAEPFRELVLLGWADADGTDNAGWLALLDRADDWSPVRFPLNGADVMARGVPRGPAVGELLATVEDWWIDGAFAADKSTCLARLDAEIAARQ